MRKRLENKEFLSDEGISQNRPKTMHFKQDIPSIVDYFKGGICNTNSFSWNTRDIGKCPRDSDDEDVDKSLRCIDCNFEGEIKTKSIGIGEDFPRMHLFMLKKKIQHSDIFIVLGSSLSGIVGNLAAELALKKNNLVLIGENKTKYDKYASIRIYENHTKVLLKLMNKLLYLQGESSLQDWYENIDEYVEEIKEDDEFVE